MCAHMEVHVCVSIFDRLIVSCQNYFVSLIVVAVQAYKNIVTLLKISRLTLCKPWVRRALNESIFIRQCVSTIGIQEGVHQN